jgi:hypothetical protein
LQIEWEEMPGQLLHSINEWVLFAAGLAILAMTSELFFRLGRRAAPRTPDSARGRYDVVLAALMTLLALLLGFSVAMAGGRYDMRRRLIVREANAISTAYRRAGFLPENEAGSIRPLLIEYLDARIAFYQKAFTLDEFRVFVSSTEQIQTELWSYTESAMHHTDKPIGVGLFTQALTSVIDLHEARVAAGEDHVPVALLLLLCALAVIATAMMGFTSGLSVSRGGLGTILAIVALSAVLMVTIDLDRPRQGVVKVPQASLIRVRQSLSGSSVTRGPSS